MNTLSWLGGLQLQNRRKIVKFKKRKSLNIGVVIFLIIFIYLAISVYYYFTKEHLSIYEVTRGSTMDDAVTQGVIIREEKVYKTDKAGYVNYFQKEGARVSKGATIYSIDGTKQVYDMLSSDSSELEYSAADIYTIRKEIQKFASDYSDNEYSKVKDFKVDIANTVSSVMFNSLMDQMQQTLKDNNSSNFRVVKAKSSGIVTYHYDGYEKLKATDVTTETFAQENYSSQQLRTSDLISEKGAVYKLIPKDTWNIVLQLTESQYEKLSKLSSVNITILKDGFNITVPVSTFVGSDGGFFANLSFTKYMERYLSERFVSVELNYNQKSGLKIPKTAVTTKEFYMIPNSMFTPGGDSNTMGLALETYNQKTGEASYQFTTPTVYYDDGTYSYIAKETFKYGDKLRNTQTQETYQVTLTNSLQGVYNLNNGYAVFKKVIVLSENQEYYIVEPYSSEHKDSEISEYDHIAADASTVTEDAIIY